MNRKPSVCCFGEQHLSESEKNNQSSLREAIRQKDKNLIKYLIQNGTSVKYDYPLYSHMSPLHLAVISRSLEIVKIVLDEGANVNLSNWIGDTPLTLAAKSGNNLMIDLLLSHDVQDNTDHTGLSHLHIACMRNKTNVVQKLLLVRKGEDINKAVYQNSVCWAGFTPLHFAVHYECLQTIRLLLEYGADITVKDAKQMTPLHWADFQRNEEIIDLILAEHKYVFVNPTNEQGLSHFHIACTRNNPLVVEHFLKLEVDIDQIVQTSGEEYRSIHFAVFHECPSVIELLLQNRVRFECDALYALLIGSLQMGKRMIYELVCSKRPELFNRYQSTTPQTYLTCGKYKKLTGIHHACIQNDPDNIKNILSEGNNIARSVLNEPIWTGCTPTHMAVRCKSVGALQALLDNGANFMLQDAEGKTPLHVAFHLRYSEIVSRIVGSMNDCPTNLTDSTGLSMLHILCSTGRVEMVAQLLSQGVDVNAQVGQDLAFWAGSTPIHFAIKFLRPQVVSLLLKSGSNVLIRNSFNQNSIDLLLNRFNRRFCFVEERVSDMFMEIFSSWSKIMEELNVSAISPLHALCICRKEDRGSLNQYLTLEHKDEINRTTYLPNSRMLNQCTALHFCLRKGFLDKAMLLLDKGADPRIINSYGQTPIEYATSYTLKSDLPSVEKVFSHQKYIQVPEPIHFHLACFLGLANVVRTVLNNTTDESLKMKLIRSINDDGATPLHSAIANVDNVTSLNEIVHLLLENGADVDAKDYRFQTPLHMMEHESNLNVLCTLISYGTDVNAQNLYGQTPLHLIFNSSWRNNKERLVLLLENGADINVVDEQGRTCLMEIERRINVGNSRHHLRDFFVALLEHVNKLRVLGFCVNDENGRAYTKLLEDHRGSFDEAAFTRKCHSELESMIEMKIASRTKLYDIIFKSPGQMILYSNNIVLQTLVNSREFFERYPMYGYLIGLQLKRGKARGPLVMKCMKYFSNLSKRSLPSVCLDAIFQYFNNVDLKNIISATGNSNERFESIEWKNNFGRKNDE